MKRSSQSRERSHTSSSRSAASRGVIDAAADAVVELGVAAESFKESMSHVRAAGKKGRKVIQPMKKAGTKVVHAVKRTIGRRSH